MLPAINLDLIQISWTSIMWALTPPPTTHLSTIRRNHVALTTLTPIFDLQVA